MANNPERAATGCSNLCHLRKDLPITAGEVGRTIVELNGRQMNGLAGT